MWVEIISGCRCCKLKVHLMLANVCGWGKKVGEILLGSFFFSLWEFSGILFVWKRAMFVKPEDIRTFSSPQAWSYTRFLHIKPSQHVILPFLPFFYPLSPHTYLYIWQKKKKKMLKGLSDLQQPPLISPSHIN